MKIRELFFISHDALRTMKPSGLTYRWSSFAYAYWDHFNTLPPSLPLSFTRLLVAHWIFTLRLCAPFGIGLHITLALTYYTHSLIIHTDVRLLCPKLPIRYDARSTTHIHTNIRIESAAPERLAIIKRVYIIILQKCHTVITTTGVNWVRWNLMNCVARKFKHSLSTHNYNRIGTQSGELSSKRTPLNCLMKITE